TIFPSNWYCQGMSIALGFGAYDYAAYYAMRAAQGWELFLAAWTAGGRSASDVVRVLGAFSAWSAPTDNLVQFCATHDKNGSVVPAHAANSIHFDALAVAPYFDNAAGSPSHWIQAGAQGYLWDQLSCDQILDHWEMACLTTEDMDWLVTTSRSILDARGYA